MPDIHNIPLEVIAHIQGMGDVHGRDNEWVGTKGQSRRLEGFTIRVLEPLKDDVHLEYMGHLQNIGDTGYHG